MKNEKSEAIKIAPFASYPHVLKRDGKTTQRFDIEKVRRAVVAAVQETAESMSAAMLEEVLAMVQRVAFAHTEKGLVDVEKVQDIVERQLLNAGLVDTARGYIRYRQERTRLRNSRLSPDPDALADYIHPGKYARFRPAFGRREVFTETVARAEGMHVRKYQNLSQAISPVFASVYDKRVLPSMRSLQFGGEAIEANNCRMFNCSTTHIDRPEVFGEAFFLLLCGCGVGYSVQKQHVAKLPKLARIDRDDVRHYVIPDTIEGWAKAANKLMDAAIKGHYIEFAYNKIRDKGLSLKTSGGKAPGHLPLKKALERMRAILEAAQGRHLRPFEAHSILCHLADAVLAGGIRRSAMIALFSLDDEEMMKCKTGDWWQHSPWLGRANNSVVLLRGKVGKREFNDIFKSIREWGEPGFYFTDDLDFATNPCCEIGMLPILEIDLETIAKAEAICQAEGLRMPSWKVGEKISGWSFCNLTTINAAKFETAEDFIQAAKDAAAIGTLQASYTQFPYLGLASRLIAERDTLLGVSMTGVMDRPDIALDPAIQRRAAEAAVQSNREWAAMLGIKPAQRVTCIKPEGTASLELGGVGSGIHPHHARRYFRRVIANSLEPVFKFFQKHNPDLCVLKPDGDYVIEFPVEAPAGAIVKGDLSAIEFLTNVRSTQLNWVEPGTAGTLQPGLRHNVSNTCTVKPEEWDEVRDFVWDNQRDFTGISFLPDFGDKAYAFAPMEAVATEQDEIKWNHLVKSYRKVPYREMFEGDDVTAFTQEAACAGGACAI